MCNEVNPLTGVKGGPKMMFLRQHRETILDCLDIFGEAWVREHFKITHRYFPDPLDALIRHKPEIKGDATLKKSNDIDYLMLKLEGLAIEVHQNKRDIEELKSLFQEFVESTGNQVAKALIIPLLRNVLNFEGDLPEANDPLTLDKLLASANRGGPRYAKRKQIEGVPPYNARNRR